MPLERWLPVAGWPGYEVSDLGRVRSLPRTLRDGRQAGGVELKATPNGEGYLMVTLSDGWRRRRVAVHKLVKLTFTGPPRGRQVRHRNDDQQDNRLSNLVYGTRKQNEQDKRRNRKRKENREEREGIDRKDGIEKQLKQEEGFPGTPGCGFLWQRGQR